jgi:hypothetical protein
MIHRMCVVSRRSRRRGGRLKRVETIFDWPANALVYDTDGFDEWKNPDALRAAMSMARLWRDQGKREETRELLAPICG